MQFRLVYQGPLRANGSPRHKQEIRRALHPQLRDLWTHAPLAQQAAGWLSDPPDNRDAKVPLSVIQHVGEFRFAPLICDVLGMVTELSIVLLRPTTPGALIRQGGDIDNQLKTLFDSLRCPHVVSELPRGDRPAQDEDPFYCLLDDDERIVDVHVATDRFLNAPDRHSVHVTLHVRTRITRLMWANLPLA